MYSFFGRFFYTRNRKQLNIYCIIDFEGIGYGKKIEKQSRKYGTENISKTTGERERALVRNEPTETIVSFYTKKAKKKYNGGFKTEKEQVFF